MWSFFEWLFGKKKPNKPTPIVVPPPIPVNGGSMSRKALLVGINAYPTMPLAGCVNDVAKMANLLMQNYGFSSADICILTDKQATTENILAKLNWLVEGAKAGDMLVFHYSGHGAQAPTGDQSEPDGLAEVVCPVDFNWSAKFMITDKQFVQIFSRIPSGVIFNWASDSCHSGDLGREVMLAPKKIRLKYSPMSLWDKLWGKVCFWKKPQVVTAKTMRPPVHVMLAIGKAKAKGFAVKGIVNGQLDVGFVSGCKSNQTSADAYIDGQPCGALTYYFVKQLKANPTLPLSQLVVNINKDLAANGYSQQPLAEGARASRPWLVA